MNSTLPINILKNTVNLRSFAYLRATFFEQLRIDSRRSGESQRKIVDNFRILIELTTGNCKLQPHLTCFI